jgi:hypothetical protein
MANETFRVACDKCKRSYSWKPERAGKKAKCQCGQIITMPMKPPTAKKAELVDDLYSLSELAAAADGAVVTPAPMRTTPCIATAGHIPGPKRLDYRNAEVKSESGRRFDSLTDPVRDLYVPSGLLAVGFIGALMWVVSQTHAGTTGLVLMSSLAAGFTIVKVVVVIGLALLVAPNLGISFGLLGPAILKFAAILLFVDAAEIWLEVILKATGGISQSGQGPSGFMFIRYDAYVRLGLATLISIMCVYLFSMDANEVAMFAVPMAIISWIIGVVINILLSSIAHAIVAAVVVASLR